MDLVNRTGAKVNIFLFLSLNPRALSLQVVKEQRAGGVECSCWREADGWGEEENKAFYTQLQEGCNQ